jgi:hypothetical protein
MWAGHGRNERGMKTKYDMKAFWKTATGTKDREKGYKIHMDFCYVMCEGWKWMEIILVV